LFKKNIEHDYCKGNKNFFRKTWGSGSSLNHHLKNVPSFDLVITELKKQIANKKLFMVIRLCKT